MPAGARAWTSAFLGKRGKYSTLFKIEHLPKVADIVVRNIGEVLIPLFTPNRRWRHIRAEQVFYQAQGLFIVVRMNK